MVCTFSMLAFSCFFLFLTLFLRNSADERPCSCNLQSDDRPTWRSVRDPLAACSLASCACVSWIIQYLQKHIIRIWLSVFAVLLVFVCSCHRLCCSWRRCLLNPYSLHSGSSEFGKLCGVATDMLVYAIIGGFNYCVITCFFNTIQSSSSIEMAACTSFRFQCGIVRVLIHSFELVHWILLYPFFQLGELCLSFTSSIRIASKP